MSAQLTEPDSTITLPVRPSYAEMVKRSRRARLAGAEKVTVIKVPAALVRRAETTIDRSPLVGYLESMLPAAEHRATGGPRH